MGNKLIIFVSLLIIASMALAACAQVAPPPAQTPSPAIAPTMTLAPTAVSLTAVPNPSATPFNLTPKDPATYVVTTPYLADMIDPALCYAAVCAEIIRNTHDTLIFYNRQDPNSFVPMLAVEVPSLENGGISADGLTYTFKIREGVRFHDGSELTPSDVAYTFQRGLLQGGSSSPQFLLTEPFLGSGLYDITDIITPSLAGPEVMTLIDDPASLAKVDPAVLEATCKQVTDAIVADDAAGTVTMKLAQPWGPFLTTIANTWGAITSKTWIISKGGWDGDCKTWQNYYGRTAEQLIEQGLGNSENGSGPYKLDHIFPRVELVLAANEGYWVEQPLWEGSSIGAPRIKQVIFKNIGDAYIRINLLASGDADESRELYLSLFGDQLYALVGAECQETIDNCQEVDLTRPLRVIKGLEGVSQRHIGYNFNINASGNELIGSGQLDGNGIPSNFFTDPLVRQAFAYCFNYKTYLNDAFLGDARRSIHVMLPGMLGYNADSPYYSYDPARCAELLKQSRWTRNPDGSWSPDPDGPVSLWEAGFRFSIPYVLDTHSIAIAKIFQAELGALNDGFIVETPLLSSNEFKENRIASNIPIYSYSFGWIEDIHDPHNWVSPFTTGVFAWRQNLPADVRASYAEIANRAVSETDLVKRAEIYKEFNQLWYDTASAVTLFAPLNRVFIPRWVHGWYYNPVYPGTYFYSLWKE